ncbi:hypothetical protein PC118_g18932 [Phytophthora cactorum]|uniref:Chromo domain-containing protein n=1 Tax=Phytophthora cactorum TaxID=29920 RepID=A0A8T1F7G8_9STRA|nr:hypothetical protein PC118_g18932 [Phytophthora cactorum]
MICDARITEYKVTSRVLLATIAVRVRVPVPLGFARVLLKRAIVAVKDQLEGSCIGLDALGQITHEIPFKPPIAEFVTTKSRRCAKRESKTADEEDDALEYDVEAILKENDGQVFVKWSGYSSDENAWEPEAI